MRVSDKQYDIIYADPPWRYEHAASNNRKIEDKYSTMDLKEIKELDIPAKDNCLLYLWATSPKLSEALDVMKAWGFNYRSSLVWDKNKLGMGYWFRTQHEFLLCGRKGKFKPPMEKKRVRSVLRKASGEHSRKPDIIRTWINEWYPKKTKIELFARQRFEGWDVWGNEIPDTIQMLIKEGGRE